MQIIWLGHGSFRIEIGKEVLLVDPWITANPMMKGHDAEAATAGATRILVTHGHFDHATEIAPISKSTGAPVYAIPELVGILTAQGAAEGAGFNMGGTVHFDGVSVTMVPASHSSSYVMDDKPVYTGTEAGFMISGEGHMIYVSGDTGIMADMDWMGDYFKPDIGILSAGGHYTMDMAQAAYAARRYFDFKTVIPCHYKTFPLLEQSAEGLKAGLPGVDVIEPDVMKPIQL
ncbi:metal-dependent hydrolase [Cognatishimia sp. F0-27]|uniref:metal-dependent hydrolase n=1 Tax=Cognatishimia sp. F0-27 TaxID=2816855 RepID=UPI001D0CAE16|nr:metal-dependent hydrolase [Cognatishimia sp. F0-27]MCC1491568.1 metal-dependent hydrolase [Cognatishimia sp. F0-27]